MGCAPMPSSGARPLHHDGDAARLLPPLSAGAVALSRARLRRHARRPAVDAGNPLPLRARRGDDLAAGGRITAAELAVHFPCRSWRWSATRSPTAPSTGCQDGALPLSLFDAVRVDYSLKRLVHYTGTDWRACSRGSCSPTTTAMSTSSCAGASEQIAAGRPRRWWLPGGIHQPARRWRALEGSSPAPWHRFQMPAYHLIRRRRRRHAGQHRRRPLQRQEHHRPSRGAAPHCWLMIGHCGGLRQAQSIGDYVLAHAYLRQDRILDALVPPEIPIPALAEVQVALQEAAAPSPAKGRGAEAAPAHRHRRHQ
jgi:AMP nucleosidase